MSFTKIDQSMVTYAVIGLEQVIFKRLLEAALGFEVKVEHRPKHLEFTNAYTTLTDESLIDITHVVANDGVQPIRVTYYKNTPVKKEHDFFEVPYGYDISAYRTELIVEMFESIITNFIKFYSKDAKR